MILLEDILMKYCTHCGAEHCDEAVICTKCGCKLDNVEVVSGIVEQKHARIKEDNFAIAGMVLGIVSLILFACPMLGIICAVLGLIFSCLARKKVKNGYSMAGFVTSIISTSIYALIMILTTVYFGSISLFWIFTLS